MKNIIFTIAAFLLLASAAFAQGSIEGTVTDAKGKSVANVTLTVVGAGGKAIATAKSDGNGAYALEGIAAGKYKVVATNTSGYKAAFLDDVAVEDDAATTLDITLAAAVQAPEQKPSAKPPVPKPTPKPVPPVSQLNDIINKHIDALGGREKLLSLKTVRMTGTLTTQGFDVEVAITKSHLIGMRTDIDVPGMSTGFRIVTPTQSISFLPFQGQSSPETTPAESSATQTTLDIQSALLDYRAKGTAVELLGTEKVDGEDSFKLKVTFKSGGVSTFFISTKTYLITKTVIKITLNGEPTNVETTYSDYKKNADGYLFAYAATSAAGVTIYTKIETNIAVDPAIFK